MTSLTPRRREVGIDTGKFTEETPEVLRQKVKGGMEKAIEMHNYMQNYRQKEDSPGTSNQALEESAAQGLPTGMPNWTSPQRSPLKDGGEQESEGHDQSGDNDNDSEHSPLKDGGEQDLSTGFNQKARRKTEDSLPATSDQTSPSSLKHGIGMAELKEDSPSGKDGGEQDPSTGSYQHKRTTVCITGTSAFAQIDAVLTSLNCLTERLTTTAKQLDDIVVPLTTTAKQLADTVVPLSQFVSEQNGRGEQQATATASVLDNAKVPNKKRKRQDNDNKVPPSKLQENDPYAILVMYHRAKKFKAATYANHLINCFIATSITCYTCKWI